MASENPKFTINIQSDGKLSLTIRTDDEGELEQLLDTWEKRIVVFQDPGKKNKPQQRPQNKQQNNKRDSQYAEGDPCPDCQDGELVERRGNKGKFWGCSNYPKCHFTESL